MKPGPGKFEQGGDTEEGTPGRWEGLARCSIVATSSSEKTAAPAECTSIIAAGYTPETRTHPSKSTLSPVPYPLRSPCHSLARWPLLDRGHTRMVLQTRLKSQPCLSVT